MQGPTDEEMHQGLRLIEELVLDAGEAVTYRRVASALCLHVNQSKLLLQKFVDKHAQTNSINVSMLVCGAAGEGNARTILCPLKELDKVHASFDLVLFEHIYAVSCASAALEAVALANTTCFEDFTQTIGTISSVLCTKLSQEEVGNLKTNCYNLLSKEKTSASISKVHSKDSKNNTNVNGIKTDRKNDEIIPIKDLKKEKEPISKAVQEPSIKQKESNSTKGQTKNNISNFFSKSNGQPKQPIKVKEEMVESNPKEVKSKLEDEVDSEINKKTKSTGSISNPKNGYENVKTSNLKDTTPVKNDTKKSKKEAVKTISKKNAIVTAHKNGKVDKKRKRVLQVSDSDDSDAEKDDPFEEPQANDVNMESDEDIIPPTPNADVVKITSGIINPRKQRKIVDKTYTTEDGYMVTRKEEVLESCSEDEVESNENIVKTNIKKEIVVKEKNVAKTPKAKKKIASPQKGKQASIMSFFAKK